MIVENKVPDWLFDIRVEGLRGKTVRVGVVNEYRDDGRCNALRRSRPDGQPITECSGELHVEPTRNKDRGSRSRWERRKLFLRKAKRSERTTKRIVRPRVSTVSFSPNAFVTFDLFYYNLEHDGERNELMSDCWINCIRRSLID